MTSPPPLPPQPESLGVLPWEDRVSREHKEAAMRVEVDDFISCPRATMIARSLGFATCSARRSRVRPRGSRKPREGSRREVVILHRRYAPRSKRM